MVEKQLSEFYMGSPDPHMKDDDVYVPPKVIAYAEADIIADTAQLCTDPSSDQGPSPPCTDPDSDQW